MGSKATQSTKAEAGERFGRYLLLEPVGKGGMAQAWKAVMLGPLEFQRVVVIKRILPHLSGDDSFVKMFVDEARLSARLTHPNIVSVFDFGNHDGSLYLAMDLVDGMNLLSAIRELRPQAPVELAAYVANEVCAALTYAQGAVGESGQPLRIVHRDISPSNIMLGFDGAVKLLDFGIAKALGELGESTQSGTLKGKFSYMSPEFLDGRPFDHRSDIFALGVVLHEVLSGRRLFKGASDVQTLTLVRNCEVAPPSLHNANVPPELDRIVLRALARDPAQRYQQADDLAVDLNDFLHSRRWGRREMVELMRRYAPKPEPERLPVVANGSDTRPISEPSYGSETRAVRHQPEPRAAEPVDEVEHTVISTSGPFPLLIPEESAVPLLRQSSARWWWGASASLLAAAAVAGWLFARGPSATVTPAATNAPANAATTSATNAATANANAATVNANAATANGTNAATANANAATASPTNATTANANAAKAGVANAATAGATKAATAGVTRAATGGAKDAAAAVAPSSAAGTTAASPAANVGARGKRAALAVERSSSSVVEPARPAKSPPARARREATPRPAATPDKPIDLERGRIFESL